MAESKVERKPAGTSSRARLAVYGSAAAVALLATAVLAVILLSPDSSAPAGPSAESPGQQTTFALFDEFHATLIVTPGAAGANTVDVILATHNGSGAPDVSEVTVGAARPGEQPQQTVPATPVPGSPGAYRLDLTLPEPGDWELTVTVGTDDGPVAQGAVVLIGER